MTTTLNIPDQLLKQAQTEAAQHGLSLQDFVTGVLQDRLTPKGEALRESLPWREFALGSRLRGSVTLAGPLS